MGLIAAFDIGTSAVKGALFDADGRLSHAAAVDHPGPHDHEQDPQAWWDAFVHLLQGWWRDGVDPQAIDALAFSGQMQDLIALDAAGAPVRRAILYSDARAEAQAQAMLGAFGAEAVQAVTGNPFNGASVLPKIAWLHEREPLAWARTTQCLFGAKDYVIHRLTGAAVTDPTTAATTGVLDARSRAWHLPWLEALAIPPARLPRLMASDAIAGAVHADAAAATGLRAGCTVICGLGDAAATTLGAGVVDETVPYAYLGTTGWIARVSPHAPPPGLPLFVLPYLEASRPILIAPVLNAGKVHRWAVALGTPTVDDAAYAAFEARLAGLESHPRLLFLPYLDGERCPVTTALPMGTFFGLAPDAGVAQLQLAALEGVCLSLRQGFDLLDATPPAEIVAVGGGTRSGVWMQLLADAFGSRIRRVAHSEYLPCLGAAAMAALGLGRVGSAAEFVARHREHGGEAQLVRPRPDNAARLALKAPALRRLAEALLRDPPWPGISVSLTTPKEQS